MTSTLPGRMEAVPASAPSQEALPAETITQAEQLLTFSPSELARHTHAIDKAFLEGLTVGDPDFNRPNYAQQGKMMIEARAAADTQTGLLPETDPHWKQYAHIAEVATYLVNKYGHYDDPTAVSHDALIADRPDASVIDSYQGMVYGNLSEQAMPRSGRSTVEL